MCSKILMHVENVATFSLNYNVSRKVRIIFHRVILFLHIKFVYLIAKKNVTFVVFIKILCIV